MAQNSPSRPRHICVQKSVQLSPHLQRIYFSSQDFADFPIQHGAHIKLFFPQQHDQIPALPTPNQHGKMSWPAQDKPVARTYTVRDFVVDEQLLVVDFVRHADFGIAADWAVHAQPGDILGLAGPGGQARFLAEADYWLMMGDLSALPMLAASLAQLPAHAQGHVWIEIEDQRDQIALNCPEGMQIHWVITSHDDLYQQVEQLCQQLDWQQQISVTLAGENTRVIALRHLFRHQYSIPKKNLYAVPYWKKGYAEEGYHKERHAVMDADA